jgi:hypothetical protein
MLHLTFLCNEDHFSSFNLMKQSLLALNFSSTASLPLSPFIGLKRVIALFWIRFWLKVVADLISDPNH